MRELKTIITEVSQKKEIVLADPNSETPKDVTKLPRENYVSLTAT
jgi:hypothetical protein